MDCWAQSALMDLVTQCHSRDHSKNRLAGAMSNAIKDLIETFANTNWFYKRWWKSGPTSGIRAKKSWV
ncbi:hypothetical protein RHMOL_Rhmol10G0120800 [Rhododendron molle]|uniref:Uncharacterized protein n=1 Tax=Rhododendron molle TaxID=49168 RepID=A0ACC0M332_RHOML|nr:hypothetical protein RHMOL_Rhmol10G0120800 [Rhododendron molle]